MVLNVTFIVSLMKTHQLKLKTLYISFHDRSRTAAYNHYIYISIGREKDGERVS